MDDKPEEGKLYALTGGPDDKCLSNGNTWEDSEIHPKRTYGVDVTDEHEVISEITSIGGIYEVKTVYLDK
jgi:hypothetical protein